MNHEQFQKDMAAQAALLEEATKRTIPIKIANAMEAQVKENFNQSGFLNGGRKIWKPSKRIGKAEGAHHPSRSGRVETVVARHLVQDGQWQIELRYHGQRAHDE